MIKKHEMRASINWIVSSRLHFVYEKETIKISMAIGQRFIMTSS